MRRCSRHAPHGAPHSNEARNLCNGCCNELRLQELRCFVRQRRRPQLKNWCDSVLKTASAQRHNARDAHLRGCAASAAGDAAMRRRRSAVTAQWPLTAKCASWMQHRGRAQHAPRARAARTHPRRRRQRALSLDHRGVGVLVVSAHVHRHVLLRRHVKHGVRGATCAARHCSRYTSPEAARCPTDVSVAARAVLLRGRHKACRDASRRA